MGSDSERSNAAAEAPAAVGITRIIERGGHIRARAAQGGMAHYIAIDEHIDSCHGGAVFLVCRPARGSQCAILRDACSAITRIHRTIDPAKGGGVGGRHGDGLRAAQHRRESLRIYSERSYGVGAGTDRSNPAAEAPAAVGITR